MWFVANSISLFLLYFVCFPHFYPLYPLLWSHCCQIYYALSNLFIFVTLCLAFFSEFYHHLLLCVSFFPEFICLGFYTWDSFNFFFTLTVACLVIIFVCSVTPFPEYFFVCRNVSLFCPTYFCIFGWLLHISLKNVFIFILSWPSFCKRWEVER